MARQGEHTRMEAFPEDPVIEAYKAGIDRTLLRENLRSLGIGEGYDVVEREVAQALPLLDASGGVCDFCFLDPPYHMRGAYERTLEFLAESWLVGPSSIVIAQHEKKFDPGEKFGALVRYRKIVQGDAGLSLYRTTNS